MTLLTHWEGEPVAVWAATWGVPAVEAHDVLGSTNDRLRALAREGAAAWTVVLADQQTAGRGRSGARWHSEPGAGLLLSVLLPVAAAEVPAHLSLTVGLAVARAVDDAAGVASRIKWPNDVLVHDRKVAGILCEMAVGGGTATGGGRSGGGGVVAGVGINVRAPAGGGSSGDAVDGLPEEVAASAAVLEREAASPVSRSRLATELLRHLRPLVAAGGWSAEARRELAARDALRDRRVTTHRGEGVARGLDDDGALLVETAPGERIRVVGGSVRML